MSKTDRVKARFNGQDITFKIERDDLSLFETLGSPAFGLFRAITGGTWTIKQLKFVLAFALLRPATIAQMRLLAHDSLGPALADHFVKSSIVDAAFAKNAPGDYVPLAQAVLGAALLGIEEENATFTDEPDGE